MYLRNPQTKTKEEKGNNKTEGKKKNQMGFFLYKSALVK